MFPTCLLYTSQTDIGNHYRDLYVRVTRKTKEIIQGYIQRNSLKGMPEVFRSNIAGEGYWYDIPFAYIPFWEERMKKGRGLGQ